jgi:thiol:disulfide interchange protein DsbC
MVARNIWCADDRAKAWRDYLLNSTQPKLAAGARDCAPPIADIAALASELGISGTPVMVLPGGQRLEGAVTADKLDALLNSENAPR